MIKIIFAFYRIFITARLGACRYTPSCSQYAEESIEKHGLVKGVWLSLKRILSCHPFSNKNTFDPVA